MNLRDLEYFVAVAELGHFGKAAERCFCTQPTLSGQLRKLEDELGALLLERLPGGVRLTSLGEQCLPAAREALSAARRVEEFGRASRDPESGNLVLGAIPTIGPYLWPEIIPVLHEAFPGLTPLLREEQTHVLLKSLRDGRVDAGILALPLEAAGIDAHELWDEPFLLAVPEGHELSGKGPVPLSVLDGMDLLLLDEGHCLREQALDVCRLSGARERDGFRATSLETLRQMVRAGLACTLLPASSARPEDGLSIAAFDDPPSRKVALCWRKVHPRAAFFPRLAESIRRARPF
jgi:LysR family transcriptional regulator, hydrogen peroxide-inducible genes activator